MFPTLFNPENHVLRDCPFNVVVEVTIDNTTMIHSNVARSAEGLMQVVARTMWPEGPLRNHEVEILVELGKALSEDDNWRTSAATGLPIDTHISFEDGEAHVMVRVFTLINTEYDNPAEALLAQAIAEANENRHYPVLTTITPAFFTVLLESVLSEIGSTVCNFADVVDFAPIPEGAEFFCTDTTEIVARVSYQGDDSFMKRTEDAGLLVKSEKISDTTRLTLAGPKSEIFKAILSNLTQIVGVSRLAEA